MKKHLLTIMALSGLFLSGFAFAEQKTVIFKIDNKTSHSVDLDTDGGVNGNCKTEKNVTTCTTDPDGKISVGGHLAIDRNFKNPAGIFGALVSVVNPADDGKNFVIQAIESSPVRAALSSEKWTGNRDEVIITITNTPPSKSAS